MKRRSALQSFIALSAAAAMPAQQLKENPEQPPPKPQPRVVEENPKLALTTPDGVSSGVPCFFTPEQFSALRRLAGILMPPYKENKGAPEARAAEFLDFLISESPESRRKLYTDGLDRLNAEAQRLHRKNFEPLTAEEAAPILSPLQEAWTYNGPSDPFALFLFEAKQDVIAATVNSREYIAAASVRRRSAGGTGAYWHPIE